MKPKSHMSKARFLSRVNKRGPTLSSLGRCWLWTGSVMKGTPDQRYGFLWFRGRNYRAHRLSWEIHKGKIPPGLCVCHKCDNPGCVRPNHLFLDMLSANNADMVAKGRGAKGVQHGMSKLSELDVLKMRRMFYCANKLAEIAKRFGVSDVHAGRIVHGRNWRHVAIGAEVWK